MHLLAASLSLPSLPWTWILLVLLLLIFWPKIKANFQPAASSTAAPPDVTQYVTPLQPVMRVQPAAPLRKPVDQTPLANLLAQRDALNEEVESAIAEVKAILEKEETP